MEFMVEGITPEIEEAFKNFDAIAKEMYFVAIPKQKQILEVAAIMPFGYKAATARVIKQKEATLETKLHIDNY